MNLVLVREEPDARGRQMVLCVTIRGSRGTLEEVSTAVEAALELVKDNRPAVAVDVLVDAMSQDDALRTWAELGSGRWSWARVEAD